MNQEIKRHWVQALRSGEYRQATDVLRRGDGFCCLGVLCDLAVKDNIIALHDEGDSYYYGEEYAVLPRRVVEWAGVPGNDPYVTYDDDTTSLSTLNDGGMSFAVIADLIEGQL